MLAFSFEDAFHSADFFPKLDPLLQQALKRLFEDGSLPRSGDTQPVTPSDIARGGLPPVCLDPTRRADLWFTGYEQTYLERDVRDLSRISDLVSFRRILRLAALRTGQLLNATEIGRDAGLNAATTTRYLNLLEASFVVRRIGPYLSNRASRLIKSPKLFLTDSGLAAHLSGAIAEGLSRENSLFGALLETYVAQNLAGVLESDWPNAHLAFWNVQGRHEVDFIIELGRDSLALEVKAASRWDDRDLAGLRAFLRATPRCRAGVLAYGGRDVVRLEDRLWAVPHGIALG